MGRGSTGWWCNSGLCCAVLCRSLPSWHFRAHVRDHFFADVALAGGMQVQGAAPNHGQEAAGVGWMYVITLCPIKGKALTLYVISLCL